jgi:hypothetical protein
VLTRPGAQAVQRDEDQGKADGDHQVAGGGQHALPAVFRRPGFGAVLMLVGGGGFAMFMVLGGRGALS